MPDSQCSAASNIKTEQSNLHQFKTMQLQSAEISMLNTGEQQNYRTHSNNFISLFAFIALLLLGLSNAEKWQLLLQPPIHFSRKLPYLLYPFHSFW